MPEMELSVLNDLAQNPQKTIENSEERYKNRVNEVAEEVLSKDARVVLLAGPSASGKTTTAHLISDAIRHKGIESFVISLDDFYRERDDKDYPLNADGTPNYECPESLNLPEIRETLVRIADGEDFYLPKFDFKIGARETIVKHSSIGNGCVIVEGLHALNPKITSAVDGKKAIKIFVSTSTNINVDGNRIISGNRTRFVRRLIRDSFYRASSAERTYSMWHSVREGEEAYLYPFKFRADIAFDTFHFFELGVMKEKALPILKNSQIADESFIKSIIDALEQIKDVPEALVPRTSLIREFITGGVYEDLY